VDVIANRKSAVTKVDSLHADQFRQTTDADVTPADEITGEGAVENFRLSVER
jgi:hypothetical protein